MPTEPFRFLHAADLFITSQLRRTGLLPNALVSSVATATESAWENVISAAVDEEVDFVLLGGSCFDVNDLNPRSEFLLKEGFDLLESHGIRVFILLTEEEPLTAWQAFADPAENITLFYDATADPVAFLRKDKVVATFAPARFNNKIEAGTQSASVPFCIGYCVSDRLQPLDKRNQTTTDASDNAGVTLTSHTGNQPLPVATLGGDTVNYLVWPTSSARCTFPLVDGTAHHPGPVQGLEIEQSGPAGCTVIDVDAAGKISERFVATAAVRWERNEIKLHAESTRANLIQQMISQLRNTETVPSEKVWLVEWTTTGVGPLFDSLALDSPANEQIQNEISVAVNQQLPQNSVELVHRFCQNVPETQNIKQDTLLTEFLESLVDDHGHARSGSVAGKTNMAGPFDVDQQLTLLRASDPQTQQNSEQPGMAIRLDNGHLRQLDTHRVSDMARHLGTRWFRNPSNR